MNGSIEKLWLTDTDCLVTPLRDDNVTKLLNHMTKPHKEKWVIYEGDLNVNGSFGLENNLYVTGNLVIDGVYSCNMPKEHARHMVVLGDFEAKGVHTHDLLTVMGKMTVAGETHENQASFKESLCEIKVSKVQNNFDYVLDDDKRKQELVKKIKQLHGFSYTQGYLEKESFWLYHKGDIDESINLQCDSLFIIDGNLTVKNYQDFGGCLIVTGDMKADNICSDAMLTVLGDLTVTGLMCDWGNDYVTEVQGNLTCKAYYNTDKSRAVHGEYTSDFTFHGHAGQFGDNMEAFFIPEVLRQDKYSDIELNESMAMSLVEQGVSIYK